MNTDQKFHLISTNLKQSLALGEKLAKLVEPGQLIELIGDLGGGKTTLVKGLAKGLGIKKTIQSPSYNIARSYILPSGGCLDHFDLYRLEPGNIDKVIESNLRESVESGENIIAIEWAQALKHNLKADRLVIELHYVSEASRSITILATGPISQKIVEGLR